MSITQVYPKKNENLHVVNREPNKEEEPLVFLGKILKWGWFKILGKTSSLS